MECKSWEAEKLEKWWGDPRAIKYKNGKVVWGFSSLYILLNLFIEFSCWQRVPLNFNGYMNNKGDNKKETLEMSTVLIKMYMLLLSKDNDTPST